MSSVDDSKLLESDESVAESSLLVLPESVESESLSTSLVDAVIRDSNVAAVFAAGAAWRTLFFRRSDGRRDFFAIDVSALPLLMAGSKLAGTLIRGVDMSVMLALLVACVAWGR